MIKKESHFIFNHESATSLLQSFTHHCSDLLRTWAEKWWGRGNVGVNGHRSRREGSGGTSVPFLLELASRGRRALALEGTVSAAPGHRAWACLS